jgi:hypothetical protein
MLQHFSTKMLNQHFHKKLSQHFPESTFVGKNIRFNIFTKCFINNFQHFHEKFDQHFRKKINFFFFFCLSSTSGQQPLQRWCASRPAGRVCGGAAAAAGEVTRGPQQPQVVTMVGARPADHGHGGARGVRGGGGEGVWRGRP